MRTGGGEKDGHADPNDVRGIIVSVLRELGVVNGETIKVAKTGGKGPTEAKGSSGKNQKKKKSDGESGEKNAGCGNRGGDSHARGLRQGPGEGRPH